MSRGTVDRALHHKEGVREEVAERIRAAAREMGYISNRLVMQQTQQWKIGVVLHSGHSPFVQMLCELFESFSERALIPNITVIVRAMQDMDVQHQLTLIDELVTTEHRRSRAHAAREYARARQDQHAQRKAGHPCRDVQYGHHRREPHRHVGADNIATGRAAAALLGMVMQGHGSVLPILGQRSGHYADSQRFTGFSTEMAESFPNIRVLHPECSFLDESLSERIAMRAIQSDSELRGIYLTSAGREGVYRAVHAADRSEKLHIVVHDITEGNIKMVKNGTVDFIIGQDVKTQGHASDPPALRLPRTPSVPEGAHEYHGYHGQIPLQRVTERSGKKAFDGRKAMTHPFRKAPQLGTVMYHFQPILPVSSLIAQQNRSAAVNDVCSGSPSRIRRVLLISFGMTTRPRSSILLTIPVAFTLFCLPFTVVLLLWW